MRFIWFLPLLTLAACASLSEDECKAGDWYAVGYEDGTNGREPDFLLNHAKACNQFGVAPVRARWEEGRQDGLPVYCRPARAWKEGAEGRRLRPVCPVEKLPALQRAHDRGERYRWINDEIDDAAREISQINRELASLPADSPSRARLISHRSRLRLQILQLRSRRALYRF